MNESFIKGSSIKAIKQFIIKIAGKEALDKIIADIPEQHRSVIESSTILASGWYPMPPYVEFLKSIGMSMGKDKKYIQREIGAYIIDYGYNFFYKIFYKLGSPEFIIKNSKHLWSSYFKPSRLEVVTTTSTSAVLRVHEEPRPDKVLCESIAGGMEQSARLSGARNIRIIETKCAVTGDPYCEYEATWEL